MRHIGDWVDYLDPKLRNRVLNTTGKARPRDWPPAYAVESEEYRKAEQAGYDLNSVHWWVYEEDELGKLNLPLKNRYHWWITKLYPGQMMPMHSDPHTHEQASKRYWIPLQDYEPGHVFIYKKTLMTDYKFGDVFVYDMSTDIHGAANIGHTPRVVLQVTEYL